MLSKYLSGKLVLVHLYKMPCNLLRKFTDSFVYNENILTITCLQKIRIKEFTHLFLSGDLFSIIANFTYPVEQNNDEDEDNNTEDAEGSSSLSVKDKRAYVVRKRPLYYNCFLLAPDGQELCTCDVRKVEWYLEKGLAGEIKNINHLDLNCNLKFYLKLFHIHGTPIINTSHLPCNL